MTFHSLRCLICLADVSIIPSAKRYDLPLEGGFRGDRRLTPLATAARRFLLVADQQRRAGWQGAGRRRLCPISLCRSSLGSTAHGTAPPPVRRKLSLRGRARCPARAAAGPPPSAPRSRGHTGGRA